MTPRNEYDRTMNDSRRAPSKLNDHAKSKAKDNEETIATRHRVLANLLHFTSQLSSSFHFPPLPPPLPSSHHQQVHHSTQFNIQHSSPLKPQTQTIRKKYKKGARNHLHLTRLYRYATDNDNAKEIWPFPSIHQSLLAWGFRVSIC